MENEEASVMKIVVASDNHRDLTLLKRIVQLHSDADLFLHAGDSGLDEREIEPFLTVKGNQDFLVKNNYRILELGSIRIYLMHGHRTFLSLNRLEALARENNCQIIIHGHTHVPYYRLVNGIHILCPGSLRYPRSRRGTTYALILINDEKNIQIEILDI
jgi:putative phosphoesterase